MPANDTNESVFGHLKFPRPSLALQKHAYSNILKILQPKKGKTNQIKNSDIFHISAQNIDCGYSLKPPRRGGSNEYPKSMFLSRNKKNNIYPYKPQFYYIKGGLRGSKLYRHVFVMGSIPLPLALEATALTTELPRYLKYVFLYVFVMG